MNIRHTVVLMQLIAAVAWMATAGAPATAQVRMTVGTSRSVTGPTVFGPDQADARLLGDASPPGSGPVPEPASGEFFVWEDGDYSHRCCGDCPLEWAGLGELVYFRRGRHTGYTLSNAFALDNFDYTPGMRVSLVRHRDCLDAVQFKYVGLQVWSESGAVAGVGLGSRLSSSTINLSEFNNASLHSQSYRSWIHNFEVNKQWYGWDVISTTLGFRYFRLSERYNFSTVGPVSTGNLDIRTDNDLFGVQIGMDLYYPVGIFYSATVLRAGVYLNSSSSSVRLVNANTVEINNGDRDLDVAGIFEVGYFLGVQVSRNLRLRAGYEFLWIPGVAIVPGQISNPLTTSTGQKVNDGSDVFYHGFSAGGEWIW